MLEAIFVSGVDEIKISGLTQWDRGQMVQIICPDLPSAFQVHFAKRKEKTTVVVQAEGADNVATVAIPDILLQEPFDLYAYLYFDEGLVGETVKTIRFPIKARQKPDDYVIDLPQEQPTETEKIVMKLMDDYVDEVADQVADGMQVKAVTLEPNQAATVQKEVVGNAAILTFGIPKGEQGESGMPDCTAADNGKVLGVVGGQVAWVKPSYPVVTQNGTVLNIK